MDLQAFYKILAVSVFAATLCNGNPTTTSPDYDTIVIGMGAAGTVAAATLARAGKKVLALEAQDRVGGRVYTVPFGDGIVEVGAEWLHGTEDSRTYKTAMENNITILPQELKHKMMWSDGSVAGKVIDELLEKGFSLMEENSEKPQALGEYATKKMIDYMKDNTPSVLQDDDLVTQILRSLRLMVESYEGAYDWNDINAKTSFVDLEGHQHMSWHRNGYKTFFELLLNKYKNGPGLPSLEIKLNTEVTKIEWPHEAEGKVSVTTKEGKVYKAENVIVTVSLGVLKHKYEGLFTPSLPQEKVRAIEKLQFGLIGKIILSFPNAWWSSSSNAFLWKGNDLKNVAKEDEWTTNISGTTSPMGSSNTITLWITGESAKQVEVLPEDVVKSKAIGILRRFIGGNQTIPEPTGILRFGKSTKWFSNKFTRGAYTYDSMVAADVPTARADLAAPLSDAAGKPRVLFAGEASHPARFSTVHGAADTGHREAMRLLDKNKPT